MVNVGGRECMCGGTHVKNTADIGSLTATKIKKVYFEPIVFLFHWGGQVTTSNGDYE